MKIKKKKNLYYIVLILVNPAYFYWKKKKKKIYYIVLILVNPAYFYWKKKSIRLMTVIVEADIFLSSVKNVDGEEWRNFVS